MTPATLAVSAVFLFFSGQLELSSCQTSYPIPSRPYGYTISCPQPPWVVLEIFYEHLCSDSKANWVIMKQVIEHFADKPLKVIMHIEALPYHRNAFLAQQVGEVVKRDAPDQFLEYVQTMFDNQDMFLDAAAGLTEPEVKLEMALVTHEAIDTISVQSVMDGFTDEIIKQKSIYAWEYGVYRGIVNPPQFLANGVLVPAGELYKFDNWVTFINHLFENPY